MSLVASAKSSGTFELAPQGVHAARCARIIDLGTQSYEYMGSPKSGRKIFIGLELPASLDAEGKPHTVMQKYTLTLSEKAQLRKDLEGWRGRAFTVSELEAFDLENLLGKACMINVVHEVKGDKTYANIKAIMPLAGGMIAPPLVGKPYLFSLSSFNQALFDSLSDGIKKMIMLSPEYADAVGGAPPPTARSAAAATGIEDDDIPF